MPCKITARNDTYSTYRGGLLSRSGASFFASHVQYNLATQYSCCLRTCILLVPVLTLDQQTLTFQGVQNRKSGITGGMRLFTECWSQLYVYVYVIVLHL
jgi:hypothetical protein